MSNELRLLIRAATFAAEKHRDQRRKGSNAVPYVNHPLAVAYVLSEHGGVSDAATLCAAILHDTIEDTCTTLEELVEQFGVDIAEVVQEVTDDKSLAKDDRKRLQIEHAPHLSHRARLVKLADKICNLRDIIASPPEGWPLERKQAYFEWAKQVVTALGDVNPKLEQLFEQEYLKKPAASIG